MNTRYLHLCIYLSIYLKTPLTSCFLGELLLWIQVFPHFSRWHSGKELTANAGNMRDAASVLGWGRSPGVENSNPLQYSCLEHSTDGGA